MLHNRPVKHRPTSSGRQIPHLFCVLPYVCIVNFSVQTGRVLFVAWFRNREHQVRCIPLTGISCYSRKWRSRSALFAVIFVFMYCVFCADEALLKIVNAELRGSVCVSWFFWGGPQLCAAPFARLFCWAAIWTVGMLARAPWMMAVEPWFPGRPCHSSRT